MLAPSLDRPLLCTWLKHYSISLFLLCFWHNVTCIFPFYTWALGIPIFVPVCKACVIGNFAVALLLPSVCTDCIGLSLHNHHHHHQSIAPLWGTHTSDSYSRNVPKIPCPCIIFIHAAPLLSTVCYLAYHSTLLPILKGGFLLHLYPLFHFLNIFLSSPSSISWLCPYHLSVLLIHSVTPQFTPKTCSFIPIISYTSLLITSITFHSS